MPFEVISFALLKVLRALLPGREKGGSFPRTTWGKISIKSIRRTICCIGIITTEILFAQTRELKSGEPNEVDIILLLDASASMRLTDPERLRDQGALLFLKFLNVGDYLGIVSFSKDASLIMPLIPFEPSKLEDIKSKIASVRDDGIFTNLLAAIATGSKAISLSPRKSAKKILILLSDGKMDPPPESGTSSEATKNLLEEVLPELKNEGISIHTLSFSDKADQKLLSGVAAQSGGINWFSPSVNELHKAFAEVFLVAKRPQVVAMKKRGFPIDEAIEEATFYVDHDPVSNLILQSPLGDKYTDKAKADNIRWYASDHFDVITIEQPEVGLWQLEGVAEETAFATLLTKLKLIVDWPNNIYVGEKALLEAQLHEGSKPVILPDMHKALKYAYQITPTDRVSAPIITDFLQDDGMNGDKVAGDGIFSKSIEIETPGEYKVNILVKSPTFQREQLRPFRVRPEWINLSVSTGKSHSHESSSHSKGEEKENSEEFIVTLSPDVSGYKDISVSLHGVQSGEQKQRIKLPLHKAHDPLIYTSPVNLLERPGLYRLNATLNLKRKKGPSQKYESKSLEYKYLPVDDSDEEVFEEVIVPKIEKKEIEVVSKKDEPGVPWLSLGGVTGINCLFSILTYLFLSSLAKKGGAPSQDTETERVNESITLPPKVAKALEELTRIFEAKGDSSSDLSSEGSVVDDPNLKATAGE